MVVPNPASWKQAIGVHLNHHPFPILNTLNAIMQSVDLGFKTPNLLLKVAGGIFSEFFAYNGLDLSFKLWSTILHTKFWETLLVVAVLVGDDWVEKAESWRKRY